MEWKEKGREARFLNVTCTRGKAKWNVEGSDADSALDPGGGSSQLVGRMSLVSRPPAGLPAVANPC